MNLKDITQSTNKYKKMVLREDTRLIDLTMADLRVLLREEAEALAEVMVVREKRAAETAKESSKYVRGLAGIAEIFQCSKSKATQLKKSGALGDALIQNGDVIIVDRERAIQNVKEYEQQQRWRAQK